MEKIFTLLFLICASILSAQVADFEDFNLAPESQLNGSDGSGGFDDNGFFLPNFYEDVWGTWTGWAISNQTDNTTPGFGNQYSAITGGGAEGSDNYALTFVFGDSKIHLEEEGLVASVMITNSTYAYFSMRDGDSFAKKFGGLTGNDPDFFLLTIKGYSQGQLTSDSIDFYLADLRFSDNSMDYIVDDWTAVNLTALGVVDSLSFTLASSDNGAFGMNTPAYFCIDKLALSSSVATKAILDNNTFTISPNPATDFIQMDMPALEGDCFIYDLNGRMVFQSSLEGNVRVDISKWPRGTYVVKIVGEKVTSAKLVTVF